MPDSPRTPEPEAEIEAEPMVQEPDPTLNALADLLDAILREKLELASRSTVGTR